LETAYAFYATNDPDKPPETVGSMWGEGTTSKKAQQPEPVIVVPANPSCDTTPLQSSQRSGLTDNRASTVVTSITMKQQMSLSDRMISDKSKRAEMEAAMDPVRVAKRKALEEEGIRWIKKLAKINVAEACFMMANWMDKEIYGFKRNTIKSIQLHTVAAKYNIPESLFAIAHYFDRKGEGMEPARILKYYSTAAGQGYVNAIYVKQAIFFLFSGK
jgi:hypothetical protein